MITEKTVKVSGKAIYDWIRLASQKLPRLAPHLVIDTQELHDVPRSTLKELVIRGIPSAQRSARSVEYARNGNGSLGNGSLGNGEVTFRVQIDRLD